MLKSSGADMTTLSELSRRVSEAEGPSRELDVEIWLALDGRNTRKQWSYVHEATGKTCEIDETRDATRRLITVPEYTASLDAVAALIAEKLPGCGWQIGQTEEDMDFRCWARVLKRSALFAPPNGVAKTPALALLAAALLAIHERNKSSENM